MMKACWSLTLALLLLPACGDDDAGTPDGNPGGLEGPAAFDRSGCVPGGFTGDPRAIYHLRITDGFFRGAESLRIDGPGAAAMFHETLHDVRISDDDVFVRSTADGLIRAIDLCARDAAGAVHGHAGWC